ncbi:MAG: FAD-dependent oxidoreductase, partial [Nocardioides sp.]
MRPDVVVVGAGVIGLTLGVCLAEQGLRVRLRSRSAPSETTSAVASAMIGPSLAPADGAVGVRERVGIEAFTALARVPGTGVALRRGRLASREIGPPLPGLQPCPPEELPDGFAAGFRTTLPLVDMPLYLDYLTRRLGAAGGQIEYGDVRSLTELAEQTPLVANCAGLGARELVPDTALRPVRGQHVVVDNPGLREFFIEAP